MDHLTQFANCGRSTSGGDGDRAWKNDSLDKCLSDVLEQIEPIIHSTLRDSSIAALMLEDDLFVEPLNKFEFTVLACGLFNEHRTVGQGFDYGTVVELTDRFQRKAMNTTMIYKTMVALEGKGLIANIGKDRSSRGRAADHFVVTHNGRTAFRLATSNALFLKSSRESVAA
ncbi:hypothetical protein ACVW1C_000067 [Bradyrhizobium sp. USDA 4011]